MSTDPGAVDLAVTPDVVGMVVDEARATARVSGVVLAQPDPDGPPLAELTWRLPVVVTSQDPAPGTALHRWESVVVTWSRDATGVREPRRPAPRPVDAAREHGNVPART